MRRCCCARIAAPGGTMQALTLPITSATRRLQGSLRTRWRWRRVNHFSCCGSASELLTLGNRCCWRRSSGRTRCVCRRQRAFAAGALTTHGQLRLADGELRADRLQPGHRPVPGWCARARALVSQTGGAGVAGGGASSAATPACGRSMPRRSVYPFTPLLAALSVDEGPARRRLACGAGPCGSGTSVPLLRRSWRRFIGRPGQLRCECNRGRRRGRRGGTWRGARRR